MVWEFTMICYKSRDLARRFRGIAFILFAWPSASVAVPAFVTSFQSLRLGHRLRRWLIVGLGISLLPMAAGSYAIPSFPGAQGWGAETVGGRGGILVHVTNLNSEGVGSLRWAVTIPVPRTIIFDVSGVIDLACKSIEISAPNVTIAGQTSPGGVTLTNGTVYIRANEVIVRHIRVRKACRQGDCMSVWGKTGLATNIIMDHISGAWGV